MSLNFTLFFIFSFFSLSLSFSNNCISTTLSTFPYPKTPLSTLNPPLSSSKPFQTLLSRGCSSSRPDGAICPDLPAIGSGLAQLTPTSFLGITDRGPNQDCEDLFTSDPVLYKSAKGKRGKGFPLPEFAPTFAYFDVYESTSQIRPRKYVQFRDDKGKRVTGISNTERDDTPYGPDCKRRLKYDTGGLDPEDVAVIPGTPYLAVVEEYSPSVLVVHAKSGKIAARYVPKALKKELSAAGYRVVGALPDVYMERRKNRGFEGVVVDKEGGYVIAIVQSPMLGEEEDDTENNRIIRCAVFDIIGKKVPRLRYRSSFVIEASEIGAYVDSGNVPKDMKYSGAQYAGKGKFVALERAKGQVKLFLVDWSKATSLEDTKFADNLRLEKGTNGVLTATQLGVLPAEKTLIWDSAAGVGGSVGWDGSSKQEGFAVDMNDPTKVWLINDNDFGIGGETSVELKKVQLGRSVTGATVCGMPPHPPSPMIDVRPSKVIRLVNSQTVRILNEPDKGAAENLDVDEERMRAYVANDDSGAVDMYDVSISPVRYMSSYMAGEGFKPTSVSVCTSRDMIAIGYASAEGEDMPGKIDLVTKDLQRKFRTILKDNCILVDSVKWSDDCNFLVGACEGEGADVAGGVIVADFAGPASKRFRGAKVATFKPYDIMTSMVKENGIRLVESDMPSVDFEPEFIAIVGNHAFIVLQENNAIAVVDLFEAKVTELKPIGYIERNRPGFALDASDKDGEINIRGYDFLYGMPQPDAISKYVADDGETYLVFVNEGDSKDDEEARGEDIVDDDELGRLAVPGLKELVEDETLLGRLKFSTNMGYNVATNTQEKMFHFGSRSFSIMSLYGLVVFDSGEWFARIQESLFPKIFNSNTFNSEDLALTQEDLFDNRSDDKGMEPESVSIMQKNGQTYAFIGLERPSIIVVFDITTPTAPIFVDAVHNNPGGVPSNQLFAEGRQGDMDPEGLFASGVLNKLIVAGSVSSTVSTYDIVE